MGTWVIILTALAFQWAVWAFVKEVRSEEGLPGWGLALGILLAVSLCTAVTIHVLSLGGVFSG